jgi:hypothetical protein
MPYLPYVLWLNMEKVQTLPDGRGYDAHRAAWTGVFELEEPGRRSLAELAYQQAMDRLIGLETKAVGLLTALGIVAAGGFVACTGTSPAPIFAIAGLAFATSSGLACTLVLLPRRRHALAIGEVLSPTEGYAEMAAATRMIEPVTLRVSNLVTAAVYDLMRSAVLVSVGIAVVVAGS